MSVSRLLLSLLLLGSATVAAAEVRVQREAGDVVRVDAANASNGEILEALARAFEFRTEVGDRSWLAMRRDLARRGTLEQLLRTLLGNTNKMIAYQPTEDGSSRVSSVTVMGKGNNRPELLFEPVTSGPATARNSSAGAGARSKGGTAVAATGPRTSSERLERDTDTAKALAEPATHTVADMMRVRAQPGTGATAEQVSATVPAHGNGAVGDGPLGVDQAALAKLTRQAQANVQQLAEALRQAEATAAREN